MENNKLVYDFYEHLYNEDERELCQPLEFIRTKEIISRYLTGNKLKIADLAGATGVYSYWLALQGHEVHLLDLSKRHIEQAKHNGRKYNIELASLTCADARKLPYSNEEFDVALQMGALYHLQEQKDRLDCIKEVYRVLKPNGIAVFSFISRYASLIDGLRFSFILDPEFQSIIENDINTGRHNNPSKKEHYFTTAFFHTPELINYELQLGQFSDIKLFAVEGIASVLNQDLDTEMLLKYIRMTECVPELLGMSSHILAVCVKPDIKA